MILYHVTDVENLPSIAEQGLVPSMGRLSQKLGENQQCVYFFHDKEDVVNACMNWLGEEFDEIDEEDGYEHQHVVLECRIEPDDHIDTSFYEVGLYYPVEPKDIRITLDKDLFVDMMYDESFVAGYPALAEWQDQSH